MAFAGAGCFQYGFEPALKVGGQWNFFDKAGEARGDVLGAKKVWVNFQEADRGFCGGQVAEFEFLERLLKTARECEAIVSLVKFRAGIFPCLPVFLAL